MEGPPNTSLRLREQGGGGGGGQQDGGASDNDQGDDDNNDSSSLGIAPAAFCHVFDSIRHQSGSKEFLVRASYLEIYDNKIRDLLAAPAPKGQTPNGRGLELREHRPRGGRAASPPPAGRPTGGGAEAPPPSSSSSGGGGGGVYVKGLSHYVVKSAAEAMRVLEVGRARRATAATSMNSGSSRSHAVFTLTVEATTREACGGEDGVEEEGARGEGGKKGQQRPPQQLQHIRVGKLNLVDLAGSERQSKTGAHGTRLNEGIEINLSLSALGNVISALASASEAAAAAAAAGLPPPPTPPHIPYRDSTLTHLLRDSLGGNTRTVMIASVSPADWNRDESLSTLRYASRAKRIVNAPRVNEDPKDAMLRQFRGEIERLRAELAAKRARAAARDGAGGGGGGEGAVAVAVLPASQQQQQQQQQQQAGASSSDDASAAAGDALVARLRERMSAQVAAAEAANNAAAAAAATAASGAEGAAPVAAAASAAASGLEAAINATSAEEALSRARERAEAEARQELERAMAKAALDDARRRELRDALRRQVGELSALQRRAAEAAAEEAKLAQRIVALESRVLHGGGGGGGEVAAAGSASAATAAAAPSASPSAASPVALALERLERRAGELDGRAREAQRQLEVARRQREGAARRRQELELQRLDLSGRSAPLEEEVAERGRQLTALYSRYMARRAEVADLSGQFERERRELLSAYRELSRRIKLRNLQIASYMPPLHQDAIARRCTWDEYGGLQWRVAHSELSGNAVAERSKREAAEAERERRSGREDVWDVRVADAERLPRAYLGEEGGGVVGAGAGAGAAASGSGSKPAALAGGARAGSPGPASPLRPGRPASRGGGKRRSLKGTAVASAVAGGSGGVLLRRPPSQR
jgi:kinesin family protein 3/17